jgi:hypothetical protein
MKRVLFLLLALFSFLPAAYAVPSLCGEYPATTYRFIDSEGGAGFTVNVTAPANCTYSIGYSPAAFFIITSPLTATGNSTITFNVGAHHSLERGRVAAITVGNKSITVNQGRGDHGLGAIRLALDFNGDMVTDYMVIENQDGQMVWWRYSYHITPGASSSAFAFGLFNEDTPVPSDYDGDQKCDFAVWRPGPTPTSQAYFYVFHSTGNFVEYIPWGIAGDDPTITQDFDGDFVADPAVVRKESGKAVWYIKLSATNTFWFQQFGDATDKPILGDFDGDYRADLAVYRPNTGTPANTFFFIRSRDDGLGGRTFGLSDIDKVVPTDFDGNDATELTVWRTTTGDWFSTPAAGGAMTAFHWGQPGDLPVPGEYNSAYATDYVVWRPGNPGVFYTSNTSGSPFAPVVYWGNSTFKVPGYTMQVK